MHATKFWSVLLSAHHSGTCIALHAPSNTMHTTVCRENFCTQCTVPSHCLAVFSK